MNKVLLVPISSTVVTRDFNVTRYVRVVRTSTNRLVAYELVLTYARKVTLTHVTLDSPL